MTRGGIREDVFPTARATSRPGAGRATRLAGLSQSEIRRMTARCEAISGLNLGQGLCRVPPPAGLLARAAAHMAQVDHSYSPAEGTAAFRRAVAAKLERYQGIELDPDSQVLATVGATGALNAVLAGLVAPGSGVLLIEPYYGYHLTALRLNDLLPQFAPLTSDWRLGYEQLAAAVDSSTRAIIICSPSNPAGRRYDAEELRAVERLAVEYDLLVITDEIYEHIYFDAEPHLPPATVGDLRSRTVSISGLSKTFSVPGWRLGYATGPAHLIGPARIAADALVVCAPTPLQEIAAEFLSVGEEHYAQLRELYAGKLSLITRAFENHACAVRRPQGAYYALVDLSAHEARSGLEAAELLLTRCGVATIPYEAFCSRPATPPLVRVCFSLPDHELSSLDERLGGLDR